MYVVGFAAVLAGGCPLRQLILAGQGSSDSAVTFLGMLIGAAFAHNGKPGLNIMLVPGIAVSGKLVLLEPKEDAPQGN